MISGFSSNESQILKNSHIKILLLENVNQTAVQLLSSQGYQVEFQTKALSEEDLIEKIKDVHVVGIRSKTKITAKVLDAAKCLLAIGCFCIGTNQVDLEHAASKGVAVFNSPFSNSRSVAELVIAEIITLSRQLGDRNKEIHQGQWNKVSKGCYEVRGKTLGIVGYGHIGSQLSVLAEALGMYVHFYDVLQIMPIGQARYTNTLADLLAVSDFVTLHVPETDETKNMIGKAEIEQMKKGSYLINASRGTVVDIPALVEGLKSGHLAGAAVDVFPSEPSKNGDNFITELQNCPNTILTPHIGGSTEEAQYMIGQEVGNALLNYLERGSSLGAVNFPNVDLRGHPSDLGTIRVLYVHHNVPGVLKQINNILSDYNVEKQTVESKGPIAYLLADLKVTDQTSKLANIHESIKDTQHNILTRIIT